MGSTLIGTLVVGAIIGWLASILAKTNNQMGCLWNIIVGVVGAALGNYLATAFFHYNVSDRAFSLSGFLVGLAGAILLILVLRGVGILKRD
jgi:uncharacterized membrane protein YeaQ/YmgE (transglycosylase-associated protein family)